MTTPLHVTSIPNVEATLNLWFVARLAEITLPAHLPSYSVIYGWPEEELVTPSFSLTHFQRGINMPYQGNVETETSSVAKAMATLEINAWVSRDGIINRQFVWLAQLSFMQAMVYQVVTRYPTIQLQDVITNPAYPIAVGYKINLGNVENGGIIENDPNPSIRRARMRVLYDWHTRAV